MLDPDISERLVSRRNAIKHGATTSALATAALAAGSVPLALAGLAHDAFAAGATTSSSALPANVVAVLNFALTLEYLENEFYQTALNTTSIIPGSDFEIFDQIRQHEFEHVSLLKSVLGSDAIAKPTFDFSGGSGSGTGPFAGVFTDYTTFKELSQAFEDTGVRAYKGQAPALLGTGAYLTTALQIHSVEARHASEVRRLRGDFTDATVFDKGWIVFNDTNIPGTAPNYAGEQNLTQAGIYIPSLGFPTDVSSEAFDEPLTKAAVLAIATLFIAA
jgi:hypothetical protein